MRGIFSSVRAQIVAPLCAFILAFTLVPLSAVPAAAAVPQYEIYPTPHSVTYGNATVALPQKASLVVEEGIDTDTVNRLDETLALQALPAISATEITTKAGLTVLVGVKGSDGLVDKHVAKLVQAGKISYDADLFTAAGKYDSYLLAVVKDANGAGADEIIVLGKDTDAAFYGLTSLYRIFQQVTDSAVSELTIADYADVQTRGFIEGYYGNPWSTQNRVDLMKWGGYNKLNAYFYAPKDDPKHNARWRDLYTDAELSNKIEPLAKAGNESKNRFIFALHPFMYSPITSQNYDESVKVLKDKFLQVIDHGVRQIAVLADDAKDQGSALYTRLMKDMTDWVHGLQAQKNADGTLKYPGLKDTIVFCPVNYMHYGESWYSNLPANVEVINTGGQVWGSARHDFFQQFKRTSNGRAAFMWMNFPCSDNDKDALHMANYENFLRADVQPGDLKGLIMNPMQQSEPSKVAIFLNSDYTWNLWKSAEHGDKVWHDAFAYVDHNSPKANDASNSMRAFSEHIRQMYGGKKTWQARESEAVAPTLTALRDAMSSGTPTAEQIAAAKKVYTDIKPAVKTFREKAGTREMVRQMMPWLDAFDDLADAAGYYADALTAYLGHDNEMLVANYQVAEGKMSDYAKNHGFNYMDHTEYAKVGKRYLKPTVDAMQQYVAAKVQEALGGGSKPPVGENPVMKGASANSSLGTYNNYSAAQAIDGKLDTKYWSDAATNPDDAFTVTFAEQKSIKHVVLVQEAGDKLASGVVEYTADDGASWEKIGDIDAGKVTSDKAIQQWTLAAPVNATGIRARATSSSDKWWQIFEFSADDGSGVADKAALQAVVNEAKELKEAEYTVFSWQVMQGNLAVAQGVLDDELATQAAADQAKENLSKAIKNLKKNTDPVNPVEPQPEVPTQNLVNLQVIDGTLAAAQKVVNAGQGTYSQERWSVFTKLNAAARAVRDATDKTALASAAQAGVDKATADLWIAIRALDGVTNALTPAAPAVTGAQCEELSKLNVPSLAGVRYLIGKHELAAGTQVDVTKAPFNVKIGEKFTVTAEPTAGIAFVTGATTSWEFTIPAVVECLRLHNPIDRAQYAGATADSENALMSGSEGPARLAIDGNPATHWHTDYQVSTPKLPHWISVELTKPYNVTGVEYTQRRGEPNGAIKNYKLYVSATPFEANNPGTPVKTGTFQNDSGTPQIVEFPAVKDAKYVTIWFDSEYGNANTFGSAAEIRIGGLDPNAPAPVAPTLAKVADVPDAVVGTAITPIAIKAEHATDVAVAGLPQGLTFDAGKLTVSGTPAEAGEFPVTVTATGVAGTKAASVKFTITVVPDTEALQAAVDAAGKLLQADYTADSWRVFAKALADAKRVLKDPQDQAQVNDALAVLQKAQKALQKKPQVVVLVAPRAVDPGDCVTLAYVTVTPVAGVKYTVTDGAGNVVRPRADDANRFVYQKSVLQAASVTVRAEVTDAAKYVFADGAQTEWSWSAKARDCQPDKPVVPDTEALQAAVDAAGKLPQADYTVDSWRAFAKALADAKRVLKDPQDQAQVNDALAVLQDAQQALKKAEQPVTPTPDQPTPDQPVTPTPDNPKPVKPGKSDVQRTPDTGASLAWTVFASLGLLSVGGVLAARRRNA